MTISPPETDPDEGVTAYTTAEGTYTNANSDTLHTSSLALVATATDPPSCAGAMHSTPLPATRLASGPIVPKRHDIAAAASAAALSVSLTIVPPACDPSRGVAATAAVSLTYSYTRSFLLNCCASSPVLTSRKISPGACAGASHFASAEETRVAETTSSCPSRQNTSSPTRCRPATLMMDTPASIPALGPRCFTTGVTWYSRVTDAREITSASAICTSSAAKPGARGGVMHVIVPGLAFDAGTGIEFTTQASSASVSDGQNDSETSPPPSARTRVGTGPRTSKSLS